MNQGHTFHIPVMGTGFSIDTPIKVARFGISSVISLVDDTLIEEMREYHSKRFGLPYSPISKHEEDHRARRITAYLDMMDEIVQKQFQELRQSAFDVGSEICKYFEMLPDTSPLKAVYRKMLNTENPEEKNDLQAQLRENMRPGEINVNIMTKLDRNQFEKDGTPKPVENSDALSALRGYAKSRLDSAIVFSAGINQRLYSYLENFKDFYADTSGYIKKRIILKVSDYRSSLIQGKFFAKKGIWVSEFRVESGLNCGGHAFATDGYLLGPILQEFNNKRVELIEQLHALYSRAVAMKKQIEFNRPHPVKITAQGGIGTAREDTFLREFYGLDGTGWGTPFLLCPEATNVDPDTMDKLAAATENDLYLSDVSPLGVPFNNLKENLSDSEKHRRAAIGRPGSPCPKGHLVSNLEFTKVPICTASRQYQKLKTDWLNEQKDLTGEQRQEQLRQMYQKSCLCHDLGEGVLVKYGVPKNGKRFPAVCPGPNLAYFSKIVSLAEMVGHIYGRISILNSQYRPNLFIKELKLYIDYFGREIKKTLNSPSEKQIKSFNIFKENLFAGIEYYRTLLPKMFADSTEYRKKTLRELDALKSSLDDLINSHLYAFCA